MQQRYSSTDGCSQLLATTCTEVHATDTLSWDLRARLPVVERAIDPRVIVLQSKPLADRNSTFPSLHLFLLQAKDDLFTVTAHARPSRVPSRRPRFTIRSMVNTEAHHLREGGHLSLPCSLILSSSQASPANSSSSSNLNPAPTCRLFRLTAPLLRLLPSPSTVNHPCSKLLLLPRPA